jgi:hypothetical protein
MPHPYEERSRYVGAGAALLLTAVRPASRAYDYLTAELDRLSAENRREHEAIQREAERAVAEVSADGQVLKHVREIVRFFKMA